MTTTASPLAVPPDDELATLIVARRRRRTPLLTLVLVVALAAAAAFAGGVEIQKHYGASSTAASTGRTAAALSALASRFGGGRARSFGAGGTGTLGGGGFTSGTVTLVRGNDLYVTDSSGNTVIVHAGTASVAKSVAATVRSISPGDSVTVVGSQQANGSYSARSITIGGTNGG